MTTQEARAELIAHRKDITFTLIEESSYIGGTTTSEGKITYTINAGTGYPSMVSVRGDNLAKLIQSVIAFL